MRKHFLFIFVHNSKFPLNERGLCCASVSADGLMRAPSISLKLRCWAEGSGVGGWLGGGGLIGWLVVGVIFSGGGWWWV